MFTIVENSTDYIISLLVNINQIKFLKKKGTFLQLCEAMSIHILNKLHRLYVFT